MTMKPIEGIENIEFLSPTKPMVYSYKGYSGYAKLNEEEYTEKYIVILNKNMKEIKRWYRELEKSDQTILLCCYCRKENFCHRQIVCKLFLWLNSVLDKDYEIILE